MTKTKTLGLKTKTKTLFFVLEAPRDQDFGLEDYITAFQFPKVAHNSPLSMYSLFFRQSSSQQHNNEAN